MREDLDAELRDLAGAIDFPPEPDVRGRVRARLAPSPRPRWPRRVALAAALAVVTAGLLVTSAGVRRAVADFLGLPGVRVEFRDRAATPGPSDLSAVLGRPATAAEARAAFGALLPVVEVAPGPAQYYVPVAGAVTVAYPASEEFPAVAGTKHGLIVVALHDVRPHDYLHKSLAGEGASLREVDVGGRRGYWATGDQHVLSLGEAARPSGNALLWAEDGVAYRLESALGLRAALRVAASIP